MPSTKSEVSDIHQPAHKNQKWKLTKSFKEKNETNDSFNRVFRVALHHSGSTAVIDHDKDPNDPWNNVRSIYGFNGNAEPAFVIRPKRSDQDIARNLEYAQGIAVTKDQKYLVADGSPQVKVFDSAGAYLRHFSPFATPEDALERNTRLNSITIASNSGNILVGDYFRERVTVHDGRDFSLKEEVYIDFQPTNIAANDEQLWVSSWQDGKVAAFNYDGDDLFTIVPMLSGKPAKPSGVVCTPQGTAFVSVVKVYESSDFPGDFQPTTTGHVHEYSGSDGVFVRCVLKGLNQPLALAMTNDVMAIADEIEVKMYAP